MGRGHTTSGLGKCHSFLPFKQRDGKTPFCVALSLRGPSLCWGLGPAQTQHRHMSSNLGTQTDLGPSRLMYVVGPVQSLFRLCWVILSVFLNLPFGVTVERVDCEGTLICSQFCEKLTWGPVQSPAVPSICFWFKFCSTAQLAGFSYFTTN